MKHWFNRFFCYGFMVLLIGGCACRTVSLSTQQEPQTVDFRELNNYFVRNDVPKEGLTTYIYTQEHFDALFGMAAFMGPKGTPSAIDFNHEAVLAVISAPLNQSCTLTATEVVKEEETLVFRYVETRGDPLTYTIRPCLLIAIPKSAIGLNPAISFQQQ